MSEIPENAATGDAQPIRADHPTIFISIASYCDPLLWSTVEKCWRTAAYPARLRFGIVDQSADDGDSRARLAALPFASQVRYVHVHQRDARGACWARSIVFSLYGGEDYLLRIDAHMIFDAGWDNCLIRQLEALAGKNRKTILSAYPWGFEIVDGRCLRKAGKPGLVCLYPKVDEKLTEDSPILLFGASPVKAAKAAVPGYHLAAGFLFTRGTFVEEVPYDPHLYFHGEEQNLAIRAYTRGWDIWHPLTIPLYHLYKTPTSESQSTQHWNKAHDEKNRRDRCAMRQVRAAHWRRVAYPLLAYAEFLQQVRGPQRGV